MNNVIMVGRITEINIDKTKNNAELTLAVTRNFKNAEGIYETDFIPCKLWSAVFSNSIEYLYEGDVVGVKGRLQSFEDKTISVIADRITFLKSKSSS